MKPLDDYANVITRIDEVEAQQAWWLGNMLWDLLHPQSVIDWGCASGLYLLPFKDKGIDVFGIDGEITAGGKLADNEFQRWDIREYVPTAHYDLALCIEVGEHLQPEYADVLVENVTRSADEVFWSAARPGQGGHCHYNVQPISYWAAKFARHDFTLHPYNWQMIDSIVRSGMCVGWLRRNTRLYERL